MYNYPFGQGAPLANAFVQTLLLLFCPLFIALVFGGLLGFGLYFANHPLFARRKGVHPFFLSVLGLFKSYPFIGLLPLGYLLTQRLTGLSENVTALLLLTVGGIIHVAWRFQKALGKVDPHLMEAAAASGLNRRQITLLILFPEANTYLMHASIQSALFLASSGAVLGTVASSGLAGLALRAAFLSPDTPTLVTCLASLAVLFLLLGWLCAHLAREEKG
jgi:ABC-type methionine transport system permease subunit